MTQFNGGINRRKFVQAAALGMGALFAPAVVSAGIGYWPKRWARHLSGTFEHGVASGDPLSNAVILWTRVTPTSDGRNYSNRKKARKVLVGWKVSNDEDFNHIVRSGVSLVSSDTDYTLKVDLVHLNAGQRYYYKFFTGNQWSDVGCTSTLPYGYTEEIKLAVMSCSNYPAGYFNVYQQAALDPDIDAVLHLGDYIYEYGPGGYATENAVDIGRDFESDNALEILELDDYRKRYAQYRTDAGLQALHASAPFICVWDDHEITNDAWKRGAENHDPETEGRYGKRKRAALKAYFEWMPIRPVREDNNRIIFRNFEFGDLINLMMLDTRIIGRDQQLDYANYLGATGLDGAAFAADVSDPERSLLGERQRKWLQQAIGHSPALWQVLGQQVLMGRMNIPAELLLNLAAPGADTLAAFGELAQIKARVLAGDPSVTSNELARVSTVLPYNLDAWDGYAAERELVFGIAEALSKNLVVLAGDTHNAWANNLKSLNGNAVGVEFATASVTSPGLEGFLQIPSVAWPATEQALQLLIDDLQYINTGDRGYMTVTFTRSEATSEWTFIDNILSTDYNVNVARGRKLKVNVGTNQLAEV